jgi:hypothetical protein
LDVAQVLDNAVVFGKAQVAGAQLEGFASIGGTALILGGRWDGSEGEITSGKWRGPDIPA